MADLTSGASAKIQLDPGQSLRVEAEGGTTNVTTLYGAPAGTTAVTGSTTFGPYSVPAMLRVVCASGACSYATVRDEPAANALTAPQVTALQAVVSGDWLFTVATLPAASPSNAGGLFLVSDENGGTLYRSNGASYVKLSPGKSEYDIASALWADRGVGAVGQIKRISDFGNNPLVEAQWNGTRWTPRGGRQLAYDLAAPVLSASSTTQVCTLPAVTLRGGSWGLSGGYEIELGWELGAGTPLTRALTMAFDGSNLADDSTTLHRRLALRRTIKNQGVTNAQQVLERAGDYATYQSINTIGQQKTKDTTGDLVITGSITSTYGSATTAVVPFYRVWWVGQGA